MEKRKRYFIRRRSIGRIFFPFLLAVLLAAMMCGTIFAEGESETKVPSSSDTFTAEVNNVDSNLTVTAYQIVAAQYSTNGLTGYEVASGVTISDIENPKADEITEIASNINSGNLKSLTSASLTYDSDSEAYTADLAAGMWIVLVSNSGSTVYNPMIVSGYYTDANDSSSLTTSALDAEKDFTYEKYSAYAKSTSASLDKVIVVGTETTEGTDVNIGGTVTFQITAVIPDYSDEYSGATFSITDTQSAGLSAVTSDTKISVTVNGTTVDANDGSDNTYSVTYSTESTGSSSFTVSFDSAYILAHGGETVVISYQTTVNNSAVLAEKGANTNTAVLTYTNDYNSTSTYSDTVYLYSFSLTNELVKTTAGNTFTVEGTSVTASSALADAEFTIYTEVGCTSSSAIGVYITKNDGCIEFSGLAAGTYYVKETNAPDGYALNDTVYKVVIAPSYNDDGTLASYTVTVSDASSSGSSGSESKYTLNYSNTTEVSASVKPTAVVDTKLSVLPTTGGIGVYVIAIASVCIVVIACIAATRKKKTQA